MGSHRGTIVCGQCRRTMAPLVDPAVAFDDWAHTDGTARCPQGAAAAVRIACAALAAAGGHPVWMGDARPRWASP